MAHQIVISEDGEVVQPPLHDARLLGLLLCGNEQLMVPVETSEGVRHCLVFQTVERLRADDFRQGNIILDVTVSSATEMDVADVAYAYGFEPSDSSFLTRTMERLAQENKLLVKVNPSFGCAAVVVCAGLEVTGDVLPR